MKKIRRKYELESTEAIKLRVVEIGLGNSNQSSPWDLKKFRAPPLEI